MQGQPKAPGGARFVGQRAPRHEDARFLTGRGRYVDDVVVPGTLHLAFARSDLARGTIDELDVATAAPCRVSLRCSSPPT